LQKPRNSQMSYHSLPWTQKPVNSNCCVSPLFNTKSRKGVLQIY
jgi:hypothetical protein